jgi:signal peptidase I
MNFDFPTLLVAATLFTGLAWAVDAMLWAPRRRRQAEALVAAGEAADSATVAGTLKEPTWIEYSKSFFPVILAVLLLRSFLVEPFRIPSGSMMPTLLVGDFILVNKYTYGLRLPVLDTKIMEIGEPRVVGVPGDTVGYFDKVVYINGEPAGQVPAGVYVGTGSGVSMSGASRRTEQLGERHHEILVMPRTPGLEGEYIVREGEYFVMGDNRDNSNDSRFWGPVPEGNLVGKAFRIWMNWDSAGGGVDFERVGMKIE